MCCVVGGGASAKGSFAAHRESFLTCALPKDSSRGLSSTVFSTTLVSSDAAMNAMCGAAGRPVGVGTWDGGRERGRNSLPPGRREGQMCPSIIFTVSVLPAPDSPETNIVCSGPPSMIVWNARDDVAKTCGSSSSRLRARSQGEVDGTVCVRTDSRLPSRSGGEGGPRTARPRRRHRAV